MKDDTTLIDEVLQQIPNKYMAVTVASKRAKAINDETVRPTVKSGGTKPTTMALEEVAAGAVAPGPGRQKIEAAEEEEKELLPSPESTAAEEK
jgi:DNA-directed RNA polymerase omega subunit